MENLKFTEKLKFYETNFKRSDLKPNHPPPLWDSFQNPPTKKPIGSMGTWTKFVIVLKIFKLLAFLGVFLLVTMSAVMSKMCLAVMIRRLQNGSTLTYGGNFKLDETLPAIASPTSSQLDSEKLSWLWAIIITFSVPEFLTLTRSTRICLFKEAKFPTCWEFSLIFAFEILHCVGLAFLTFQILPRTDSMGVILLLNCVGLVPALLSVFNTHESLLKPSLNSLFNVIAVIVQLVGIVVWSPPSLPMGVLLLGLSLFFISFRWWENYISSVPSIGFQFKTIKYSKSRYHVHIYTAPIKVCLFAVIGFWLRGLTITEGFTIFVTSTKSQSLSRIDPDNRNATQMPMPMANSQFVLQTHQNVIVWFCLLQIISSYFCFILSKFASKTMMQKFGSSLPLCIASPITVVIVAAIKTLQMHETNQNDFPGIGSIIMSDNLCIWLLCWMAQIYVTRHIWYPTNEKNAPTEKLFVCPWYCGLLIDSGIAMNRHIVEWKEEEKPFAQIRGVDKLTKTPKDIKSDVMDADKVPQLVVCATMWHETPEEMMDFLKSILRLDEHHNARNLAKIHLNDIKANEEYYELESNIFFDDAFVLDPDLCQNPKNPPLNKYVKALIASIKKATFEVYSEKVHIKSPVKIPTPYGGRLVWMLPGRSKLIAHLKNKDLIRHKKRWSQVMYMYYFLGYRIMELENISPWRKYLIANNTFLLALDGDIDFQPQAVQLLIDRMRAVDELGAACGRIHPVGKGPMAWYQTFEYAIGHWLQKATEHVIGCVLCSPGCFSLFRGSALMENNVMKRYTTVSQEPVHYIQYDQGEDRWLCTLLLKQGLRVEYSAAADAFTHCPENFGEFYNQRRRWIPSTIANIFDLLSDASEIVKRNSSVSMPYIAYQMMLMIGTIFGPGTIFLMMVGALVAVFNIDIWTSFLWNFFPVLIFIFSCIYLKQKLQILLAFVISSVYCLVMMAVLIGIVIQIIDDGPLAPASLFFLLVFGQICIAGLLHPQEVSALLCGFIYYITIPCMYMLLLIYSVFNMNDVSWGTREVEPKKNPDETTNGKTTKATNVRDKVPSTGSTPTTNANRRLSNDYLPGWLNDPLLLHSELGQIAIKEKRFWKDLIKAYLQPLFQTPDEKVEIIENLKSLRNIFSFAFIMVNAIFVLIVFLLQLKKGYIHVQWPVDPVDFMLYDDINSQIYIYRQYKELDPIGLCFVLFFGTILIIQFIAMFFHRFATISQMLATISLDICTPKS